MSNDPRAVTSARRQAHCPSEGRAHTARSPALTWTLTAFLLGAPCLLSACGDSRRKEKEVKEIVMLLEQCPDWQTVGADDARTRKQIMACVEKISQYPLESIREAMEEYITELDESGEPSIRVGKLCVVNKYVFNVPQGVPRGAGRLFGGWLTADMVSNADREYDDMLWPLSVGPVGDLVLSGVPLAYNGPPYFALAAFDYYEKEYGRRMLGSKGGARGGVSGR